MEKYALIKDDDVNPYAQMWKDDHTILNKKCFRRVNQCYLVCVKKENYMRKIYMLSNTWDTFERTQAK